MPRLDQITTRPDGLTIKRKKFVANKVKGMTNADAYVKAGYRAASNKIARTEASKLMAKPSVQIAIDKALVKSGFSPEHSVYKIKQIVDMPLTEKSAGAIHKAALTGLELHGYRSNQTPHVEMSIKNAFFNATRNRFTKPQSPPIIDAEPTE